MAISKILTWQHCYSPNVREQLGAMARAGMMRRWYEEMEERAERAWGKMGEMVWKLDGRDGIDFPQVLHLVGDFVPMF